MIRQYIKYIKDNPKGYWFRAKWYGWGWVPATWQGWIIMLLYITVAVLLFGNIDVNSHSVSDTMYGTFVPFTILVVSLIAICYWKGEPPHWSWGGKKKKPK